MFIIKQLNLFFLGSSLAFGQISEELDRAYKPYLPNSVRESLLVQIQALDWSKEGFAKLDSVEFTSEESKTNESDRIHNRVRFIPGKNFNLWHMEQRRATDASQGKPYNQLLIAVETKENPEAFYLEFGTTPSFSSRVPLPKPFTAACFSCHASGPRVIRYEKLNGHPFPNEEGVKLIDVWNQEIASLKRVKTYFPSQRANSPVPPIHRTEALMQEKFRHRACTECHNSDAGLRAPLMRQHRYSILALLEKGHMPQDAAMLPKKEIKCIEAWLKGPEELAKFSDCNAYGESLRESKSNRKVTKARKLVPKKTNAESAFSLGVIPVRKEEYIFTGKVSDPKPDVKNAIKKSSKDRIRHRT